MPIVVTRNTTATSANILSGTDLQSAPGPGILTAWLCSTQLDTVVSLSAPPTVAARSINPVQRTNALVSLADDVPTVVGLAGGEQISLAITIITAATVQIVVMFVEG